MSHIPTKDKRRNIQWKIPTSGAGPLRKTGCRGTATPPFVCFSYGISSELQTAHRVGRQHSSSEKNALVVKELPVFQLGNEFNHSSNPVHILYFMYTRYDSSKFSFAPVDAAAAVATHRTCVVHPFVQNATTRLASYARHRIEGTNKLLQTAYDTCFSCLFLSPPSLAWSTERTKNLQVTGTYSIFFCMI